MFETPGAPKADATAIWSMIKQTFSSWNEVNAPQLGAALAFYTLLSIAPLLVIAIGIGGLAFGAQAAQGQIMWQIQDLIGPDGAAAIQSILQHARKPGTGILASGIGVLVLLFGASGVFGQLRDSLDTIWGVKGNSGSGLMGMLRYRFVSFAMVLGIGFLLLVSLMISAFLAAAGRFFGGFLPVPGTVLELFHLFVSFVGVTLLFALIYKVVPDIHIEWNDVWIGAAVTSLLFSIGKFLIGLYLGKAGIGSTYGAAGSLVVVLVWVYYSAMIFFLGAEFTHVFAQRHGSRAKVPPRAAPNKVRPFRNPRLA